MGKHAVTQRKSRAEQRRLKNPGRVVLPANHAPTAKLLASARCLSRVTGGLAVVAALLPLIAAPTAQAASVPPTPTPATVLTIGTFTAGMNQQLDGSLCQRPNTCTPVVYVPFFTAEGAAALENALANTSASHIIVFGYSNGAEAAEQWLQQHLNATNAPSPDVLSFVLLGNPTRAFGGVLATGLGESWPASPYQVIDVARQYDGIADFPNNPASPYYLLALANADAGFLTVHLDYTHVNISDPANAAWTVGNTTYVLVPTETLPLLMPLQALGINVDALNAQLKPLVDQAYLRPTPLPTTSPPASPMASPASSVARSPSVVSDPTVAPEQTTVPVNLAPVATADKAGAASITAAPTNINSPTAVPADSIGTPTRPDPPDAAGTVQATTTPTAKPTLDNAIAATQPTTTTNRTSATTADTAPTGNTTAAPGKLVSTIPRSRTAK